ncbi:MAG: M23 family metallopeptidase, partial [Alistipes sp.]|nr:M23 family metallopeptidase [Alistipes sp.]
MNLRNVLLTFLMFASASIAFAPKTTAQNTINRDSLPDDAIVVKRVPLESGPTLESKEDILVVDTIPSSSEGLNIVLYNDNTWRYVRNRNVDVLDETVFTQDWDTTKIQPYNVELKDIPISMVIDLVDSLKSYHYPFKGRVTSKYGPRRRRIHQGTDIDLETGDPVYATFDGRVRVTTYVRGGYGNLVILRHDNGLETYYGHLSEISVKPNEWVTAGQVIGKGGNTGRSTGSHLHFEMRYKGQTFDPERLIDFSTGTLRRETFLLKRTYFS